MPSPFPGMNPFLEQDIVWHDFHQSFLPLARAILTPQVRPGYFVKVEEHLFIHELPAEQRRLLGETDVAVTSAPARGGALGAAVRAAPTYNRLPAVTVERHAYLEIRDRQDQAVVTVLELLSPSNKKPGPDREQYLAKRRRLLASSVNLVEIDLLRGGPRLPLEDPLDCAYYVLVSRAEQRPVVGVWPLRLRDRLPDVPIPLRAEDGDAQLDLQEILHRLYDQADYQAYIYTGAPQPPLAPEDAAWARQFVPAAP